MRLLISTLSAVLLLADAAAAKAIAYPSPILGKPRDDVMRRTITTFEAEMERRSAAAEPQTISSLGTDMNTTISTACVSAMSGMTSVTNSAGFAGCYNILEWDSKTAIFQADLRIYQQSTASGVFANISANQITVMLTYPDSTQFKALLKRSTIGVTKRDGNPTQIQQYSLAGNIRPEVDVSRLNQTLLASLMVPQISLQIRSSSSNTPISANMTAADSAWFVAGQFTSISTQAAQVANPATATAAIAAAKGFVLPGTTFGIFPVGLIITSVWMVLFVSAFGLGTVGRMRSKNVYRRRIASLATRARS